MQEDQLRKRQTETEEQGAKRKKTKRDCMRRKREEMRQRSRNDGRDCNGEDMTNVIDCATKEAKQFLHRTQDPANPNPASPATEKKQKQRLRMSQEKKHAQREKE